jgi:hypothetical protein
MLPVQDEAVSLHLILKRILTTLDNLEGIKRRNNPPQPFNDGRYFKK